MPRSSGGGFERLGEHLAARAAAGEARATLAFAAIEALVGRPLPPSARDLRRYRAWWMHTAAHARSWHGWTRAGWRVAAVDPTAETVTFARSGGTPPP